MIKIGEYYVIDSKTSANNRKIVKVLNIYNDSNIARVNSSDGKCFQISLKSLKEISKYDIIRNLKDEYLEIMLKKSITKKKLLKVLKKEF